MSVAEARPFTRLDRWLVRNRLRLEGLTWPGAQLLDGRLAVRRRADRVTAAGWAAAALCLVAMISTGDAVPARSLDASVWWAAAATVLVAVAVSVRSLLVCRGEQQIAAGLSRRVAGDHALPTWRRIGPIRLAAAVLVLVGSLVMVAALMASSAAGSLIAWYVVLFAVMAVVTVIVGGRDITRAAIAVDEPSLRVDDRWRSQSLYIALAPLIAVYGIGRLVLPISPGPGDSWLLTLWLYGPFLLLVVAMLEALAQAIDRHRLRQPTRWADWRHQP